MIKINCESDNTLKLTDMVPFQGKLKKRTDSDIQELIESLETEGLMMPFAIWKHDDKNYLLDGHGRKEAITKLAVDDAKLLVEEWPVIYVNADSEDEARKALLQITSSYGKVTKSGYKQFCVSIPDYRAPIINKFISKTVSIKKSAEAKGTMSDNVILRVKVKRDKLEQVKDIFKQFDFMEVL